MPRALLSDGRARARKPQTLRAIGAGTGGQRAPAALYWTGAIYDRRCTPGAERNTAGGRCLASWPCLDRLTPWERWEK